MKAQRNEAGGRILLGDDTGGTEVKSHRVYIHSRPSCILESDLRQNVRKVRAAYVMKRASNSRKAEVVPHTSRRPRRRAEVYSYTFLTSALKGGVW